MTHRVTIFYDEYLNYEIRLERRNWLFWHYVSQRRATNKFEACRIALAIAHKLGIEPIDKAK